MTPPAASFSLTTRLAAPAEEVWRAAVSPAGINHELGPYLRMTMPKGIDAGMTIDDAPLGETLGRSWILLGGILPVEFDNLRLVERGPGMRFLERSELGSARSWEHEREVVPIDEATCELSDRLALEVRAPLRLLGGTAIATRVIGSIFRHRHRRLEERWGVG